MRNLTLLIKPASSLCNMRCKYCFYENEAENRQQKSMGIMDMATMETLIRKAMHYIGEYGTLAVTFQGGEPTLAGAQFFEAFVETAERVRPKGTKIYYSVQTNGLCLSEEMIGIFKKYHFLVGISVDGYEALHDVHRTDAGGHGTWARIFKNLERLQMAGIETNALCVITAQAAQNAQKIYQTLKSLGFRYQQYVLCLDPLETKRGSQSYSVSPSAYGNFLKEAFDLWYADWKRGDYVSVRMFEDFAFNMIGVPCSNCAVSGSCGQYLVVEADGSVYPCDFYALDEWKLGNINIHSVEEMFVGTEARRFGALRENMPEECARCRYVRLCRTGCRRDWEIEGAKPRNYYCTSFQMLFDYALPRLAEVARAEAWARSTILQRPI